MLHVGPNVVEGVPVKVVRKRIRRINLRVEADGTVALSVPRWWATLKMGEEFLKEKWKWVLKAREEVLSRPESTRRPVGESEVAALMPVLDDLNACWARRLGEPGVTCKIRTLKSVWGSCHIRKRQITYSAELARAPHDLVEYVVVHELTHLQAADHGPRFYALMDARLPGWKDLRTRLNRREFIPAGPPVQADFLSQLFARCDAESAKLRDTNRPSPPPVPPARASGPQRRKTCYNIEHERLESEVRGNDAG